MHRLEITNNCSLSVKGAALFFAIIAFGSLSVAGGFAVLGFWPILPFAGAELFLLGLALGLSLRNGRYRETIEITDDDILVQHYEGRAQKTVHFSRHWARVELRAAAHRWHPSRLLIGSHGRMVEVGRTLTESDRQGLRSRLAELLSDRNNARGRARGGESAGEQAVSQSSSGVETPDKHRN